MQKVLGMKAAWNNGDNILDPDDFIDLRVDVRGLGRGTVVDYLEDSDKKADIGKHIVEFDSGKNQNVGLAASKSQSVNVSFKIMDSAFVTQYMQKAMRDWTASRAKKSVDAGEGELKNKKLGKLGKLKSTMMSQRSYDKMQSSIDSVDEARIETQIVALREIFKQFDTDGDGFLQKEEFENMTLEFSFRGSADQLDEVWAEIKSPDSGLEDPDDRKIGDKITFEMMKAFLFNDLLVSMSANLLRTQLSKRVETYKSDMLLLKRLFSKYDTNSDGTINFEEFEVLASALQFRGTITDLSETFKEIDTDGSGTIEFPEFKRFFTQNNIELGESTDMLRGLLVEQLEENKVTIDTLRVVFAKHDNGRGFIDKFDFDVFSEQLGYSGDTSDLEDMFAAMDTNNDDLIDWDEWVDYFLPVVADNEDVTREEVRRNLFEKYTGDSIDLKVLRQYFDSVDINNNGSLDIREFRKLCGKLGFIGTELEITESFNRADEDGGGGIDWNEFRDWYNAKNPDAVQQAIAKKREDEESSTAMLKGMFEKFDQDGNGVLQRSEFKKMAKAIKLDANAKQCETYFKDIDKDKSGEIEYEEFAVWYATSNEESVLKHKLKASMGQDKKGLKKANAVRAVFRNIDANGSGEVDVGEMLQLAVDLGVTTTKKEFDLIFQEMDLDGGGTINFYEFNEWMNKKGGKGDGLRKKITGWYNMAGDSTDHEEAGFGKGRGLLGTKRVTGKATYFFSRSSGAYSELKQFAAERLKPLERAGFSTIDKVVYFQQTALFEQMDLLEVLQVAKVAEQLNLLEGDLLFDDGQMGHAAYFIVNGEISLHIQGVVIPMNNTKKPFGEISLLQPQARAGKMTAGKNTILMCLFRDDMQMLFKKKLVNENRFMHALGELVINSLRFNYSQLDTLTRSGSFGADLAMEIARSGWSYDNSDFIQMKPVHSVKVPLQSIALPTQQRGHLSHTVRAAPPDRRRLLGFAQQGFARSRNENLAKYVDKMVKHHALNAAVLSPNAYSSVEKVVLLKSCTMFEVSRYQALCSTMPTMPPVPCPCPRPYWYPPRACPPTVILDRSPTCIGVLHSLVLRYIACVCAPRLPPMTPSARSPR